MNLERKSVLKACLGRLSLSAVKSRRNIATSLLVAVMGGGGANLAIGQGGTSGSSGGITYVQAASSGSDGYQPDVALSFPSSTKSGDFIVVAVSYDTSEGAQPTVTDSQGNHYSVATIGNNTALQQGLAIFYSSNVQGGLDTITAGFGFVPASYVRVSIHEYAGAGPLDVVAQKIDTTGTSSTNGVTSGNAVTTAAGDLIFAAVMGDSGKNTTVKPGTGFTQRTVTNNGKVDPMATEDKILATAGTVTGTFTFSVAGSYQAHMVAFRKSGASTPASPVITSPTQASAQAGSSFQYQIVATNNPTGFTATGLPSGLNIDTAAGLISGVPSAAGNSSVALSAGNSSGKGTATLQLAVKDPPTAPTSPTSPTSPTAGLTASGPITINGQNGTVISGLKITSTSGTCVTVSNSTNIVIKNSDIGPCGGNAVKISGGDHVSVYDSYIHPEITGSTNRQCCDHHDGVSANGTNNLTIQGNVIAYGEANIEVTNVNTISVIGNFLLNPTDSDPSQPADGQSRGQHFQAWSGVQNVLFQNNYTLSSRDTTKYLYAENQEDAVNFGLTNGFIVRDNYIQGGHSPSGCGVITDDAANNAQILNNTLIDTGQCGIGIATGTSQMVTGNRVLNRTPVPGGGNSAIYVWNQYDSACGPVTISNNVATTMLSSTKYNSYWNGGGCSSVTSTNNTWDAAAQTAIEPVASKYPAPQVPPQPNACAAVSPYTTQSGWAPCSGQ